MNYTISITEEKGKPSTFNLSGYLTIKTSTNLHAELLMLAQKQQGMRLEIKDVEDLDTAFLQLLLALNNYHKEHQKPFYLQLELNPALRNLVQVAGLSKTLNPNLI